MKQSIFIVKIGSRPVRKTDKSVEMDFTLEPKYLFWNGSHANCLLLNQFDLSRVNLVFDLKLAKVHNYYASLLILYFNLL